MRVVVLTGAGISAESGLGTFRASDGLWEGYDVRDVATPEAWDRNPELVQRFYNERRRDVLNAKPNAAHLALAALETNHSVEIITQNIDDLHERAGSKRVLHLHGEIRKSRSSVSDDLLYDIDGWELRMGDRCERGSQLRPHVVWFGEPVPMMDPAVEIVSRADVFLVVGTSLVVYPAAGLLDFAPPRCEIILVDPEPPPLHGRPGRGAGGMLNVSTGTAPPVRFIKQRASTGVPEVCQLLSSRNSSSKTGGPTSV